MSKIKKFLVGGIAMGVMIMMAVIMPASAVAPWNVTGTYEITFFLDPDTSVTPYIHHATLNQTGSGVTGDGGYPATGGDTYHWNVTSGTQTGDSLSLTVLYDLGATGTVMNMTGAIAPNGTVSGTWTDDFGGPRSGTWSITKGVSVPLIHTPANNAVVTQSSLVKVDWTDSIGSNPPFEYMYEAFSDIGYTSSIYASGWLVSSEILTPGTPPGDYYLRVKAKNVLLEESAWSNGAGNVYKVTVTADPTPTPGPFAVPAECTGTTYGAPIVGTSGSDIINGTSGPDLIFALGGSDWIDGKQGNDCIVSGDGSDLVVAGNGDDVVLAGDNSDSVDGGNGQDRLYGGDGSDSLSGGNAQDQLWGGAGSDSLNGGNGADQLTGDGGSDAANGNSGQDTCNAESETSCEL